MTPKRLLVALALVCAAATGTSSAVGADILEAEQVEPVILYVTDIPEDDPDGGLIVRTGPSTSTSQIDVLDNGTAVTAVSWPVNGFFVEISEPIEGWVGVKFLTLEKPEQPIRQIDAQNARPAGSSNPAGSNNTDEADAAPDALALDDGANDDVVDSGGIDRRTRTPDEPDDGLPLVPIGIGVAVVVAAGVALAPNGKKGKNTDLTERKARIESK